MHPRTLPLHTREALNNSNTLLKGLGHCIWWHICTELGKSRNFVKNRTFSAFQLKTAYKSGFSTLFLKCLWRPQNGSDHHTINSFWKAHWLGKELVSKALGLEAWLSVRRGGQNDRNPHKMLKYAFWSHAQTFMRDMNLVSQLFPNAPWDLALALGTGS